MTTQLTAAQLATLKAEIANTPALLAFWEGGTPTLIADPLNDPANGTYAGIVTLTSTDKATLLTALRPALASLPGLSAALQQKWDRVIGWVQSVDTIMLDASSVALFGSAVTDGVLTAPQAAACYQRTGSWAEVNFGAGMVLQWWDVTAAMNS